MSSKIILTTNAELIDQSCRDFTMKLEEKISIINERTKTHTKYIKELEKKIKELTK